MLNHRRQMVATVVTAATALAMTFVAAPGASAAPSHKVIPDTTPSWLESAGTVHVGAPPAAAAVTARVYLAPRGGPGASRGRGVGSRRARRPIASSSRPASTASDSGRRRDRPDRESYLHSAVDGDRRRGSNRVRHRPGTVAAAQTGVRCLNPAFEHDGRQSRPRPPTSSAGRRGRFGAHRDRPGHHAKVAHTRGTAAGRVPQRPAVLDLLRPDHGQVPGRLQDAAAEVQRQDAAVRAVRLHRPAVPRRLRGQHRASTARA